MDANQPLIRKATIDDSDAIAYLWRELVKYHRALDADLPTAARGGGEAYARRLSDRVDDSHTHVLVAEVDGQVVGYVLGMIVDLTPEMFQQEIGGFLADIYVEEAYRKQGIGRQLVEALSAWFQARGVRYIEWYVAAQNPDGRKFWQAVGGRDIMIRMRQNLSTD